MPCSRRPPPGASPRARRHRDRRATRNANLYRRRDLAGTRGPPRGASRQRHRGTHIAGREQCLLSQERQRLTLLDERLRTVIELRFLHDFDVAEIAAHIEVDASTAACLLDTALNELRRQDDLNAQNAQEPGTTSHQMPDDSDS